MVHVQFTEANNSPVLLDEQDEVIKVSGYAVHEGTFKKMLTITAEELQKAVHTLIGKKLLVNHDNNTFSVVGKITDAKMGVDPANGKKAVYYEADFDAAETDILRKMRLGFLDSTSVGFDCEHICSICGSHISKCAHWFGDEGFQLLAQSIEFLELSIVAVPADRDATVKVNFSAEDVERFEQLKKQKMQLRRTNMSDYETKYNEAVDKLSQMKIDHAEEIAQLKEDFNKEKDQLQVAKADKDTEIVGLKGEIKTLKDTNAKLGEEIEQFKETFAKIENERLSELRSQVLELNNKVNFGLTEEEVNDMGEAPLKRYLEGFSQQTQHMVTIEEQHVNDQSHQQYHEENVSTETLSDSLVSRLTQIRGK